jgi:RHS repeat-associated protein
LSDRAELIRGTDPLDPDSDNDGVPDGSDVDPSDGTVTRRWEVPSIGDATADGQLDVADGVRAARIASAAESGSPGELSQLDVVPTGAADGIVDTRDATLLLRAASDQDVDGDGLASRAEVLAGASPFLVDSDGDGVGDATELASGTDPARPDSDSDGLTDLEEVTAPPVGVDPALTDPAVTDTDEDGIPDGVDGRPLDAYVFYHGDLLGSSTLVTNVRGDILAKLLYKPFGESLIEAGSTPEFGFTGQRFEGETGLYNYGARVYDPVIGRMISADSVVPDPANLQALNRYSYVFNDPVHYADPSGNTPQLQVTGPGTQQYDPAVFEARFQGAVNAGAGTNPGGGFYSGGGFSGFEHGAGNAVLLGAMQRNAAAAHARAQAAAHAAAHPRPDWSSYADTAGMAAQIGTEAFVPFFSTATAFAAGDWRTAAQEAAFELGGIALGAATLGPGYYAVKTLKAYRAVRKAQKLATRGKTEVVHRWMSKAELNATKESGLMRGGREGRHFVRDSANSTAKRARQRLALDRTPEVRVRLEVPAGKFSSPTRVDPKHSMPGGGMERSAVGDIPVRVLD